MITSEQARMARAALQVGVRQIAALAQVTPNTVSRFENGIDVMAGTVRKLEKVYLDAGIEFIPESDGKGPGVRLTRPVQDDKTDGSA